MSFKTLNGTGTGEYWISIHTLDKFPLDQHTLIEPQPPGTYNVEWNVTTEVPDDCVFPPCETWIPGNYKVVSGQSCLGGGWEGVRSPCELIRLKGIQAEGNITSRPVFFPLLFGPPWTGGKTYLGTLAHAIQRQNSTKPYPRFEVLNFAHPSNFFF